MLLGIFVVTIAGFLAGEGMARLGLPKLIGMLLMGILIGPYVLNILPEEILLLSHEIRMLALLLILFKAGLGLDREKLLAQGSVAVRLGFLPAVIEASVVAIATRLILGWEWLLCWLLGWIICAASPAVIVPMMLRLKAEGYGVKKGIPDLILAGGTASDATAVTLFGIFLAWIIGDGSGSLLRELMHIPLSVVLGVLFGFLASKIALFFITRTSLTDSIIHDLFIALGISLLLLLGDSLLPYSPFLSIMVLGFLLLESDPVLARRLRREMDKIWVLGEIFLFVLIGSTVNIFVMVEAGWSGLAIIGIGLVIGRWLGIFASTWGSIMTTGERMFMVVGDMAKATVQAAIGGIPLAMGVPHGEYILAISVLAILITAPLGAFGTAFLAPRLLERGEVDPTKVTVKKQYGFLVALDGSKTSLKALTEATRLAREMDASLSLLYVQEREDRGLDQETLEEIERLALDVQYSLLVKRGDPKEIILSEAQKRGVDYIFIGKANHSSYEGLQLGDTALKVVNSSLPVLLIDSREAPLTEAHLSL